MNTYKIYVGVISYVNSKITGHDGRFVEYVKNYKTQYPTLVHNKDDNYYDLNSKQRYETDLPEGIILDLKRYKLVPFNELSGNTKRHMRKSKINKIFNEKVKTLSLELKK